MRRLWFAFLHSLHGFRAAWRDEAAFREEVLLAIVLLPLACWLAPGRVELALLIGSVLLVMVVELLNTALEAAIDRIGPEIHPLAKKAKDTASAAVLLAIVMAVLIWAVVLF